VSEDYSVVIPAYNAERTIEACLLSVAAQTLAPRQVLVIDDDSRDGTEAVVRRCERRLAAAGIGLEYFRLTQNSGPSVARNKGIREAKGSYIAFLDADDIWRSDKLAIVDRFASGSSAGLVCHACTDTPRRCEDTTEASYEVRYLSTYGMLLRNPAQTSCAVIRKQPGFVFDVGMRYCEDYDLWMRISEDFPVILLVGCPLTCLGRPQLSKGGLSGDKVRMRAGQVRVFYNFCRRDWRRRAWFLPGLILYSLLKHVYSWLRRSLHSAAM
jgi:glycosyltransferase involved in cell wall biosynthesis